MTRNSLTRIGDCLKVIEEVYNDLGTINNSGKMNDVLDELQKAKSFIKCISNPNTLNETEIQDISEFVSYTDSLKDNEINEIMESWEDLMLGETVSVNSNYLDEDVYLGEGTVDQINGNEITISFADRTVVFLFPESFEAGLLTF